MRERVQVERTYRHSVAALFDAWIDVELLSLWFGCDADTRWQIHQWDPVAGGSLHVSMEMDGKRIEMTGEFIAVDRPERIHYRWGEAQTVTAEFFPTADGCRLLITHEGELGAGMGPILNEGWSTSVAQLAAVLESQANPRSGAEP